MRTLAGLLLAIAIIGGVVAHQKKQTPPAAVSETKLSANQPAVPKEPSQHNWPKRALDRAADVKRQVAEQRKQNNDEN